MIHGVRIVLRGYADDAFVRCDSIDFARATAVYAATTWLRKTPADRAGVWLVGHSGSRLVVDEKGVGESATFGVVAAIDPREVVAVLVVSLKDAEDGTP